MDDIQEILEDFLIEAFELIEQLDQDLVELENNPEDLELLNSIFRVAHTVKGSSSFLSFDVLTKLTHHMEDVLNKARKGELKLTEDVMDVVLESIDMMKTLLFCIRDYGNDTEIGMDLTDIIARLDAISSGKELPPSGSKSKEEPKVEVKEEKEEESQKQDEEVKEEELSDEDYSNMSDEEVEAEIERLLKEKKAETKKKKEAKKAASPKGSSAVSTPKVTPKKSAKSTAAPAKRQASTLEQTIELK